MISTVKGYIQSWRIRFAAICLVSILAPSTRANPWSRALGDARAVQYRTKDIADRLNREFPYSQVATVALHMDNAACQLVEDVKCGASWQQVQVSLSRTCGIAGQVNALANADCDVRNDRRTRDYINDLSKRVERLRCNLDKAFAATQPKFCPPPAFANSRNHGWNNSFQYRETPMADPRFNAQPGYPRDTYEFDSPRYDEQPLPFGTAPEALPPGRPVGPIEYRVERNVPTQNPRAAAFVQLGLQAIKLIGQNR